jgi:hypothetical protein
MDRQAFPGLECRVVEVQEFISVAGADFDGGVTLRVLIGTLRALK